MKLYRFILPALTNDGRRSYEQARKAWASRALDMAGGVTVSPAFEGYWRNDEGRTFKETVFTYDVACSADVAERLLSEAFDLFPDQEALAYARLGTLDVVERVSRAA